VYSNAQLVREPGFLQIEDYTESMGNYDLCYEYATSQCHGLSDAGDAGGDGD
jgi:hypothetical protein